MDSIVNGVLGIISQHPKLVFWAVVIWWFLSAAVSSLPTPGDNATVKYKFLYAFLHALSGSVGRITDKFRIGDGGK